VRLRWLLLSIMLLPAHASGQLRGIILDETGRGIRDVTVEAWTEAGRIGFQYTDSTGRFTLDGVKRAPILLFVTHPGFEGVARRLTPTNAELRIALKVRPASLPELTVDVMRHVCPNHEDAKGRAIWQNARRNYQTKQEIAGFSALILRKEGNVPAQDVGTLDQRGLVAALYFSSPRINNSIATWGYATKPHGTANVNDYAHWLYPDLGGRHAHHFVSDLFGARNTLQLVREDDDTWTVSFCSIMQPGIQGSMTILKTGVLLDATWRFSTPVPLERAGGQATFGPPHVDEAGRPHLVPVRSTSWLYVPSSKLYHQQVTAYADWRVSAALEWPKWPDDVIRRHVEGR
jgi:hypothetical protein